MGNLFSSSPAGIGRSGNCAGDEPRETTKPERNDTMSAKNGNKQTNREMDVEVLYQKLGDRWFAFSLVEGEVFMSPVSDEVIQGIRSPGNTQESGTDETA